MKFVPRLQDSIVIYRMEKNMIKCEDYLILEKKEDFLKYWDKNLKWKHAYMYPPKSFPCAFVYQKSLDPWFRGAWRPISITEAKEKMKGKM